MLLQSHEGYIHVLPALPSAWKNGSFTGLCARGGYTVSAKWCCGEILELSVTAKKAGKVSFFSGKAASLSRQR
jgi:alpha-L-fucosidase 2